MIEKNYLLHHINLTIAHKNLILLKLEFSHVDFLQHRIFIENVRSFCSLYHAVLE